MTLGFVLFEREKNIIFEKKKLGYKLKNQEKQWIVDENKKEMST